MPANTVFNTVNLDFDTIKQSLKSFLREQPLFKDYDFEGSNLNVLMDILSYNTFHNNFYLNMVANEMFLDSATLRDSVVSHAKELNYTPQSFRSAEAIVDIEISPTDIRSSVTIPKNTTFSTLIGSSSFTFSTNKTIILNESVNNVFTAKNVSLFEGVYVVESFVINYQSDNQRFVIGNPLVDIDSITVVVVENDVTTQYERATSLLGLTEKSNVFFVQACEKDCYEIVFGNGIIGLKPKNLATVLVEYRPSSGELPNGAKSFSADRPIDGVSNVVVSVVNKAAGGTIYESIDSIKFNAPRHYQTQERAVTSNDYKTLLKQNFPDINDVSVYGGEVLDPPQYGRVFIAVDVFGFDGIPDYKKNEYKNWIKNKTPLTIEPIFIDPSLIFAQLEVTSNYNSNVTESTSNDIKTRIMATTKDFIKSNLNKFDARFRPSKLVALIDQSHSSIVGSSLIIKPYKKIVPKTGAPESWTVQLPFAIENSLPPLPSVHDISTEKNISSSTFISGGKICQFEDDNEGNLRLITQVSNQFRTIKNVGFIDYTTGLLTFNNIIIDSLINGEIRLLVEKQSDNYVFEKNFLFDVDVSDITVEMVETKE